MEAINSFLSHTNWFVFVSTVCEIGLLALVIYLLLRKPSITQAGRVIKGILVVSILVFFVYLAKLHIMVFLLRPFLPLVALVLVIIFQPEIRHGLSHLGSIKLFSIKPTYKRNLDELAGDINQIILAVKELAINKFGALLVIEPPESEHLYLSPGTRVNADISSNLIISICCPKTPLHDGAIIIQQGKIKSAGVILPITDKRQLSPVYGTRHRAALGLSEVFDCLCILVSEETGSICTTYKGNLQHYKDAGELAVGLKQFYSQQESVFLETSDKSVSYQLEYPIENSLKITSPETDI
jgi:diadenylate cyclase